MKQANVEETLWEMGAHGRLEPGTVPDDAELEAFRAGELDEREMREMAVLLARNADARERLRVLASVHDEPVSADARESFVRAVAASRPPRRAVAGGRFGRPQWWRVAAAAIVVVGSLLVWRLAMPGQLPPDLDYQVVSRGIESTRSATGDAEAVEALPDTLIRIEASPTRGAIAGVDVGLYRLHGRVVTRLEEGPHLMRVEDRGAVTFAGRARDLVGTVPATYTLFVVVASRGDLPRDSLRLDEPEDPVAVLGADGRRRVYAQSIRLRPPSP